MIVVENRIAELINLIPNVDGLKPVFHYGEGKELNAFLIGRNKDGSNLYPLVYQTSYRETQNIQQKTVTTRWEAILATATRPELYNTQREATTYQNVLYPLFGYIDKAMRSSNFITSEYVWDIEKWPNYSESKEMKEHGFLDVVDAMLIRCELLIDTNCINQNILF